MVWQFTRTQNKIVDVHTIAPEHLEINFKNIIK